MPEKTYTIILADGTVLNNLKLNGNNYISSTPLSDSVFRDNCSPVCISDGTDEECHTDMDLVQIVENSGEYWFVLRDLSERELVDMKLRSDIEYLAMMAGVEL